MLFSMLYKFIIFNRRSSQKLHRLFILILFSIVFIFKNFLFNIKSSSLFNHTQIITSFENSLLFPIHGSIKCLGKACSIYIINLPSRTDRRIESIALMQTLNLQAALVPAYSIYSPEIHVLNQNRNSLFLKLTELACWGSHMRLWTTIVNKTLSHHSKQWSLIFEDDIDLEMDISYIMKTFPNSIWNDADLIYLGHCANPPGKLIYQTSKHIYRIHKALHPSCTHAYAIRSDTARKLISLLSRPSRPIDDSIVKLVKDYQLVVYSIHPPLAIQKTVSPTNPSNVNLIDRQSLIYYFQSSIYKFLQWWNGVQPYENLYKSTLERANLTTANCWQEIYYNKIWKKII